MTTALDLLTDYERLRQEADKLIGQNIRLEDENTNLRRRLEEKTQALARSRAELRDARYHGNVWRKKAQGLRTSAAKRAAAKEAIA